MLCCQSAKERERRENKRAIERHLRKSKRQARKELKLLVLGNILHDFSLSTYYYCHKHLGILFVLFCF